MKQFYLLLAVFLVNFCTSQVITFTDPIFKSSLLLASPNNSIAKNSNGVNIKIDINNNQNIEVSEALNVYRLNLSNREISNMQEVSYFTNLTSLDCDQNFLNELNVSMLANLTKLNCSKNALTNLNVDGLINLQDLDCGDNNLTSINVVSNTSLVNLNCSLNDLVSINLTANTLLQSLNANSNNLSSIDLSNLAQLDWLEIASNNLTIIDLNSQLLTSLNLSENNLSSIDVLSQVNLTNLNLSGNELVQLDVSQLVNLSNLNCAYNNLASLSVVNSPSLQSLICSNNQLQDLTLGSFEELLTVDCSSNLLTEFNTAISSLEMLDFSNNLISSFNISLFPNLRDLYCNNNQLSSLNLNSQMLSVSAAQNQLTEVIFPPDFYAEDLNFAFNNLSTFSYQGNLSTLFLSHNNLTTYDILGCYEVLDISHNQITNLNLGSACAKDLNCSFNNLTALSTMASGFDSLTSSLNCSNNNLISIIIPNIPLSNVITFDNNPNLEYLCVNPQSIAYVNEKLDQYNYTDVEVNSYCVFTPGGSFYTISGNQRYNFNGSSCSTSDPIVPNLKFNITDGSVNGTIISDESGAYSIPVQAGQHTVTPVVPSSAYYSISPNSFVANFPTQASPLVRNFCITANGTFPDIETTVIPIDDARPGFDSTYKVLVKNVGTTTQSGTVSFSYDESVSDFVDGFPAPANTSTGLATWVTANIAPFSEQAFFVTLNHNSPMETPALNSDDLLSFSANMQTSATDVTPDNNISSLSQVVVNSFDPNDKTCLAGPTIGPEQVGKFVNYMIRFENTGTAAAQRVIITDRIDTAKFDISTLTPMDSSHPFTTRISNGNRVEFIFENIQLGFTDETNDGYVVFKIKTVPTLVVGDTFSNSAAIYFDFNYPIFTNDATTEVQVLGTENFDWQKSFAVFPNPMNAELTVKSLTDASATIIEVFNTLGQLVISVIQPSNEEVVDVSRLAAGNYFVKMYSEKGVGVAKVIKE